MSAIVGRSQDGWLGPELTALLDERDSSLLQRREEEVSRERALLDRILQHVLRDRWELKQEVESLRRELESVKGSMAIQVANTETSPEMERGDDDVATEVHDRGDGDDGATTVAGASQQDELFGMVGEPAQISRGVERPLTQSTKKKRRFSYAELNSELPISSSDTDGAGDSPRRGSPELSPGNLDADADALTLPPSYTRLAKSSTTAKAGAPSPQRKLPEVSRELGAMRRKRELGPSAGRRTGQASQVETGSCSPSRTLARDRNGAPPVRSAELLPRLGELDSSKEIASTWLPQTTPKGTNGVSPGAGHSKLLQPKGGKSIESERSPGRPAQRRARPLEENQQLPESVTTRTPTKQNERRTGGIATGGQTPITKDGHAANSVVRKKADRDKLIGTECRDCDAHWDFLAGGNEAKKKQMLQECSRHRYQHAPPQVPEHWNDVSFTETRTQPP